MKVLTVAESYLPESSGGAVYAYELAKRLGEHNVKTLILTRKFGNYRDKKTKNVEVLRIDISHYKTAGGSLAFNRFRFIRKLLTEILRRHKDFDLIHVHSGASAQFVAWALKKIFRIKTPIVMTLHGTFIGNWKLLYPFPIYKIYDTMERKLTLSPNCDLYFVVDDGSGAENVLIKGKIDRSKIIPHFHAVDTDVFSPTEKKKRGKTVVYIGRLDPFKGVEKLINAMSIVVKKINGSRMLICGDGPLRKSLEDMVKGLGLSDKIKFTGNIPHKKVPYYINLSDVFVYTDIRAENHRRGLSLSMCEALACGALCLFSYYPREEWKLKPWVSLDKFESSGIAEKILDMLETPEKYDKIKENARKIAIKYFSWNSIVKLYLDGFYKIKNTNSQ